MKRINVREVHEFLNEMWESIFEVNKELGRELAGERFEVEPVEEVFGAYMFIEGKWELMNYPHPAFEIKPQMEVGATPESYYLVVAVPKQKANQEFISAFIDAFPQSFVYGSENFLSDIYNWKRDGKVDAKRLLEKLKNSKEKVFQFEANFENTEKLVDGIKRAIKIGKRFSVFEL